MFKKIKHVSDFSHYAAIITKTPKFHSLNVNWQNSDKLLIELWLSTTTIIIAPSSRFQIPFGCFLTVDLKDAFPCAEDICHSFLDKEKNVNIFYQIPFWHEYTAISTV